MLPQYEISEIIGRGGMGAVYRGRQVKLNRTVAIKLLCPNRVARDSLPTGSPEGVSAGAVGAKQTFTQGEDELNFAKRFEQEAQAMANLDHPAIISVYDFGETANGQLYFVMEFVDGMDVFQYLHQHGGKLPQESALTITAHVLDALDYAHSHGIVHRDIKPANILLNHEGRVKIADFGLAKKFGEHADPSTSALTIANVAVGTPDFVAPEALDSDQTPDHRADLYAVGVMLYQMLTGKLPRGNFQWPSELDGGIDERLDEIVSKAMANNPEHRYQSAAAVRADLDLVLSQPLVRVEAGEARGEVAAAVPVTTSVRGGKAVKTSSKLPVYLGIAAAAVLVVGLIVMVTRESRSGVPPLSAVEKSVESEQTFIAPKPDVVPAENTGKMREAAPPVPPSQAPKESRSGVSPLASAEKAPATPTAPNPEPTPAKTPAPPPKAPEPIPTPVAAKPAVPTADSTPPNEELSTRNDALLSIPGMKQRLDAYHTARNAQLTELATKYGRGLDTRLDQAAAAGDLKLANAFTGEKDRLSALIATLAVIPVDPVAAAGVSPELESLPEDVPEGLAVLRQTWTAESAKILADLDGKLGQSMQALETELTRARDFEKAKSVLAWRELFGERRPGTKGTPFENSLGMKFVPVPGTDVLFCIHEVRFRDYADYARKTKETVDSAWKIQSNDGFEITRDAEDHPVTRVNCDDAQKFCAWLSEKEGKTYRLPTDREWSLAVGIGRDEDWKSDTTPATVFKVPDIFPWGDEWPPPQGAGNYSDQSRRAKAPRDDAKYVEGGYDDGFPTTAPVMSFEANQLGLYDLGGNVWEWCEYWYSGEQNERVLRGGSWFYCERGSLLSSYRYRSNPGFRSSHNGFRVVVAVSSGG
jgi:serine/threonine protein kinase